MQRLIYTALLLIMGIVLFSQTPFKRKYNYSYDKDTNMTLGSWEVEFNVGVNNDVVLYNNNEGFENKITFIRLTDWEKVKYPDGYEFDIAEFKFMGDDRINVRISYGYQDEISFVSIHSMNSDYSAYFGYDYGDDKQKDPKIVRDKIGLSMGHYAIEFRQCIEKGVDVNNLYSDTTYKGSVDETLIIWYKDKIKLNYRGWEYLLDRGEIDKYEDGTVAENLFDSRSKIDWVLTYSQGSKSIFLMKLTPDINWKIPVFRIYLLFPICFSEEELMNY